MQRMAWLLSQHVLAYRIDSHTNHLPNGKGTDAGSTAWTMSLKQGAEVTDALVHYSAGELNGKLERITGHGDTKPNNNRFPNQPEKNRRIELSLVLDMSKKDLAQYK